MERDRCAGEATRRAARRLPRGPPGQGRDRRRDRRLPRRGPRRTPCRCDVDPMALDIVGTGGDVFGTVNVSTMAPIVVAAAGVPVVKHGNRAASSSKSGSSDVLAALGVDLDDRTPTRVAAGARRGRAHLRLRRAFHPGFGHAAAGAARARRADGVQLPRPARATPRGREANAVGVAQLERVPLIMGVFQTRGATALVFRGDDGLDELTTTGHSHIWEVTGGRVTEHDLDPRDLGIARARIERPARRRRPSTTPAIVRRVLAGETGPVRDIVLLNAAAGLVAFGLAAGPGPVRTGRSCSGSASSSPSRPRRSTPAPPRASSTTGSAPRGRGADGPTPASGPDAGTRTHAAAGSRTWPGSRRTGPLVWCVA